LIIETTFFVEDNFVQTRREEKRRREKLTLKEGDGEPEGPAQLLISPLQRQCTKRSNKIKK
jgi:hypothetical protein